MRLVQEGYLKMSLYFLCHIKNSTEEEAHRQLGENEWSTTLDELDAFISILYARGIYGANNLELDSLWSVVCAPFSAIDHIDEQLFPSKARRCLTQYMTSKPDTFGIKFWIATDVDSKYVLKGFPYLCKDEERPVNLSFSEYVVLRLILLFVNKARNIIAYNFFTTLNLSQMLKTKNTNLTGTINEIGKRSTWICEKSKDVVMRYIVTGA
ncbi:piggyBac transposable element-derived protein 3 [Trichonephila clavipes]|nr:piggyBac transposable element-derived protein 3 [Trichonephila clavipes]